uniref:Dynein axonemal assembly factor 4 n=1 Tax=Stegastes partitus TaxID=144197 RepID=A0A3B4ZWU6_9TELE
MPLLVSDYSWTQTDSTVYINVPLKGAKARNVDIVCTEEYLKVSFPPYLFESFLFEPVDEDRSSAKVGNGVALISLPKKTNKHWQQLMINTSKNDKEKNKEIRERALLRYQEKLSSESRQKAEKQQKEKKYALETMMKVTLCNNKCPNVPPISALKSSWTYNNQKKVNSEAKSNKKKADLPPPRISGNIQITFTPRVFPTALRESRVAEEEEWLNKQAEARRTVNSELVEELKDLTEEQRNPDWLKDKGDKCFASGDYLGAVNAYSLAIRLNRKIPALYSNRAACHLKLKNLHKAIEDASQALDLLTPPVAANAAARARASVRRGSAFCQLQLYTEGLLVAMIR